MDVRTLRDRVVELSQHGVGNDVDINGKALGWLNSAYHELMDEVVAYMPASLQVREDVATAADGTAMLGHQVYRLVKVVLRDGVSGKVLPDSTPLERLEAELAGEGDGSPARCYVSGAIVGVHPAAAVDLSVLYVPRVEDLAEADAEAAILLPPVFHSVLVWGALVWSALFDRGFMSQSELVLYQRQWLAGKESVKLSLLGTRAPVRVQSFELV